jgi:hypothetical protein
LIECASFKGRRIVFSGAGAALIQMGNGPINEIVRRGSMD